MGFNQCIIDYYNPNYKQNMFRKINNENQWDGAADEKVLRCLNPSAPNTNPNTVNLVEINQTGETIKITNRDRSVRESIEPAFSESEKRSLHPSNE
jgi:hypothetical protein